MNSHFSRLAKLTAYVLAAMLSLVFHTSTTANNLDNQSQTIQNLSSMPLSFTENQGQWDDKVQFRANAGRATMWFASDGVYYQFTRTIKSGGASGRFDDGKNPLSARHTSSSAADNVLGRHHQPDPTETIMIKASFVGANQNPQMVGVGMMEYKCNYFIGNDNSKWATNIPNYSSVMYEELYDGIDLEYYGNGKQMEYDFIVSPGADFSQIKIQYEGAESISINDNGELVVTTKWGEVVEQRPVIYQIENNNRIQIDGKYLKQSENSFGFELSGYNPSLPLVIDPVLSYSTYLGGSDGEIGYGIAVDASGAAYVVGVTLSSDFPTFNPYQGTMQGSEDVFVTKLSSSGNSLIYSTYLGGSDYEVVSGITVDDSGAVYITGDVDSEDFPILNPYQGTFQGINDAYVTKLSSSGSLVYSTYLGGSDYDYALGIAIDASGAAYVTGNTYSIDFPTLNPYQGTHQGGFEDVFVTKLSSSGNSLVYSTYLGGSDFDDAYRIAVDASGAAYVAGWTESIDFPTFNPYQGTLQGITDVFVTKLSSSGDSLVYSTYLGGSSNDYCEGIAVDAFGAAYVTGRTVSADFPTFNPYQGTYQGGAADVFVTKLSSSGNSLVYSTYLGGTEWDEGYGIAVDASGAAYITGVTSSTDFPTQNPYQTDQPFGDVFVTKMNNTGDGLLYSTYLGGNEWDEGHGIAVDAFGAAYITGRTWSTDFPTLNPYQGTHQGGIDDVFVTKLASEPGQQDTDGDGVPDPDDNCPSVGNPDQEITITMTGDVSLSGTLTSADIIYLVNYIFKSQAVPMPCAASGDVNCSGAVTSADIIYMVNHVFKSDAPPCDVCTAASLGWTCP